MRRGIVLALEALSVASEVGAVALAVLAIPPGFLKLEEVLRNLSTRRKKRTEISSDLGNLMKGIVKLPSVNVDEFADELPCPLIGSLGLQGSGASKVGSRLVLHETQLQKLLLVELKRTQMCTPTFFFCKRRAQVRSRLPRPFKNAARFYGLAY